MSAETMKTLVQKMNKAGIHFHVCTCEGWIALSTDRVPKYVAATDDAERYAIALCCDVQKMRGWLEEKAGYFQCHGLTKRGVRCNNHEYEFSLSEHLNGKRPLCPVHKPKGDNHVGKAENAATCRADRPRR